MQPAGTTTLVEMNAALLQAVVALSLGILTAFLYHRHRKPYLGWFTVAWLGYLLRLGAIVGFLSTGHRAWLFWHQAFTGWTALALLWAAIVFARGAPSRPRYLALWVFPPVWSFIAIYQLDHFLLAALPAVLFLSAVTFGTGWVFASYFRHARSAGAALLAAALLVWSVHHLDYPFLRARGAWAPWGYYLDILFMLATGAGIFFLLLDDLRRGLTALLALARDLQRSHDGDVVRLLERPLSLPAATGSALFTMRDGRVTMLRGAGVCASWPRPASPEADTIAAVIGSGAGRTLAGWPDPHGGRHAHAFAAVVPVPLTDSGPAALLIVGDARNPFAALDADFLVALAQQVGAALDNDALYRRLAARTADLEHLSLRMVQQHESERRRLSLHLHDETAQLLTAIKLQLGLLREEADAGAQQRISRILELMDEGLRSIRNVTNDLRPSLLDDLGLVPALRSLAAEFSARAGLAVTVEAPDAPPSLSADAELALFRALQESLSNVAAHAGARRAAVRLAVAEHAVVLEVGDDGCGFPAEWQDGLERAGHLGLVGMRERIAALGGSLETGVAAEGGARVAVALPMTA